MNKIYLDYNATTPIDPEVAKAMQPYLTEYFGNPSSIHEYGIITKKAVEKARKQIAGLINCNASEIIFTSGGTESNNYSIKGSAFFLKDKGNHIITSSVEHPAVMEVCAYLEKNGFEVTYLPVDEYGMVQMDELEKAIRPTTILITIMHANNEIGTLQPIAKISEVAKKYGIRMHTDAAQSIGKVAVDVQKMGIDLLSIAGHKLYAPKGIGALYIKEGTKLEKLMHGANHEQNLRAGTENVLEIVGLGKACELATNDFNKNYSHVKNLRDSLYNKLLEEFPELKLNGHPEKRLPNTLSVSFPGVEADTLLSEIEEIAASAGAACHSEGVDLSEVLVAIKVPISIAMGTIRLSTGKYTTEEEIEQASKIIIDAVKRLSPSSDFEPVEINNINKEIKLTHFTHGLGCACKIRPQYLERILKDLPISTDPRVMIGNNNSDDAAVYKINDETAIVQTVDFFTPVVDNPYDFGQIAAANSISDIYAMGAKPLFALNIVGFPDNRLPEGVLKEILQGAADKAKEAGIEILGGHTVEDTEPKFGMTVTATIHPKKIISNSGAKPGDVLILTKPIGTGIIATGIKRGMVDAKLAQKATNIMSELNAKAAEIMSHFPVNACTDVTGFGLLGHLKEMTTASNINAEILYDKIPFIDGVFDLALADIIPGGTKNNMEFVSSKIIYDKNMSELEKLIINDAQTSGGLLISLPEKCKDDYLEKCKEKGIKYSTFIGTILEKGNGKIRVIKNSPNEKLIFIDQKQKS
ncbi:MAG: selenide, water dikinase SelD [Bacteroidota bacterium]